MTATRLIRLLEATAGQRTITLAEIFQEARPDQHVADRFSMADLSTALTVRMVHPHRLTLHGFPVEDMEEEARESSAWEIVDRYMGNPPDIPIVTYNGEVLDGHHRTMAAYLTGRLLPAVDTAELDSQEDEDGTLLESSRLKSTKTSAFDKCFAALPSSVQAQARGVFKQWIANPESTDFRALKSNPRIWRVSIGRRWRALAERVSSSEYRWYWIGSHEDYNRKT